MRMIPIIMSSTYQRNAELPSTQIDREIGKRLAENEIRYTGGRKLITEALLESDGPRSANELFNELAGTVPLSSVYRSLSVLEETGVLTRHFGTKGVTRYELAEWLRGHHHHLTCVRCGSVEDISIPSNIEETLESLIGSLAATFIELIPLKIARIKIDDNLSMALFTALIMTICI